MPIVLNMLKLMIYGIGDRIKVIARVEVRVTN